MERNQLDCHHAVTGQVKNSDIGASAATNPKIGSSAVTSSKILTGGVNLAL